MTKKNFMEEFVEAYHSDPVRFVQEMLGATPFDYQTEFLRTLAAGERRMSCKIWARHWKKYNRVLGNAVVFVIALPVQSCCDGPHQ